MDYPTLPEDQFINVVLQSPFVGTAGQTTFTDESLNTKIIQRTGNTQISTTQSKWGSSVYFDGTGDRLTYNASIDWFLDNTYTIEFWAYPTSLPVGNVCRLIMIGANDSYTSLYFGINSDGSFGIGIPKSGTTAINAPASSFTLNEWHHYAFSVSGGSGRIYKDGVLIGGPSTITTQTISASDSLNIGYDTVGTVNFNYQGYLQDLRITKGIGRYSSNFTPPTSSFLPASDAAFQFYNTILHLPFTHNFINYTSKITSLFGNGNTRITNSEFKFSPGSVYLDGTGDYFAIPYTSDYDLSRPTYTIECWFKINSFGCNLFAKDTNGSNFDFSIGIANATTLNCYTNATFTNLTVTVPSINTAIWHHIAYVRNLGVLTIYLDGIAYGSSSMAITNASQSYVTIGCSSWNNPSSFVNGYLQDFRYVKNKAIYTANFTPPTQLFDRIDFVSTSQTLKRFLQYNPAAMSGAHIGLTYNSELPIKDYEDGGTYFIEGNVTVDSTPSSRKVRLYLLNNGRLIRQTWSDASTGYYKFDDLKDQPYFVWSEDYKRIYDPVSHLVQNNKG